MKKVCIFNTNIYCLLNPISSAPMGGAELDLYTLAKGLQGKFDISIITGDWGQKEIEKKEGIKIYKSFSTKKKFLNYAKAILLLLKILRKVNADVYISSGAGPEVGILASYCKLFNKKYIYRTAHDIDCNGEFVKKNGFLGKIFEFGLLNSSKIVVSVERHKNLLLNRYEKFSINNNIFFISLALEINKKRIENTEKDIILWIARGTEWKRPEIFLDLATKFQNEKFVMIMPKQDGEQMFFDKIKKRADFLENVEFIGGVPFEKTQEYFNRAKIFVNTSDSEGFTYTLIQSGVASTPVAYLNVNPDEVITKYSIGEFANGNIDNLTNGVKTLCENKELWKKKSNAIYDYVVSQHDIKLLAVKWVNLLKIINY